MQFSAVFLLVLVLAASAVGCKREAVIVPADRIYTVDEFLAAPDLRHRVSAVCSNDPGQAAHDPNCINLHRADRVVSSGSLGGMPRVVP